MGQTLRWLTLFFFFSVTLVSQPPLSQAQVPDANQATAPRGLWNTFKNQLNVLECAGRGLSTISVSFFADSGQSIGAVSFPLTSHQSHHEVLNLHLPVNGIGTLSITSSGEDAACSLLFYQFSPLTGELLYAYSVPLSSAIQGRSFGTFNRQNPADLSVPTENWLSLVNLDTTPLEGTLFVYDYSGAEVGAAPILPVAPGARMDLPLLGTNLGFYEFVPSAAQHYAALLIRYASRFGVDQFAIPLAVHQEGIERRFHIVSTVDTADVWLEVANPHPTAEVFTLALRSALGSDKELLELELQPKSQVHLYLNSFYGVHETGSAIVEGAVTSDLILYGKGARTFARWAYASSPRTSSTPRIGLINTFLNTQNWMRTLSTADGQLSTVSVYRADGGLEAELELARQAHVLNDLDLHRWIAPNQTGSTTLIPLTGEAEIVTEQLRVYSNSLGAIEYITTVSQPELSNQLPRLTLELVTDQVNAPVHLTHANDGRIFIVERAGRIRVLENGILNPQPILDIRDRVGLAGEQGLHSLAFDPNFSSNQRLFVHYNNKNGDTVVSRFLLQGATIDPLSEAIVLTLPQPHIFHNGGQIAFGPDGYLYIALGDGGLAFDPDNHGQDPFTLLGSILRIDTNVPGTYVIPADNPFANGVNGAPEVWAIGFRNPWRFSFDPLTGRLFAGDVGQNEREEIDLVTRGGNYGWHIMEGSKCFFPQVNCDTTGLILPIAEYTHDEGVAVVGGHVYRGSEYPSLQGSYVFGDYASGRIWLLNEVAGSWVRTLAFQSEGSLFISSFGVDAQGELYLTDITGKIFRIRAE